MWVRDDAVVGIRTDSEGHWYASFSRCFLNSCQLLALTSYAAMAFMNYRQ